MKLQEAIDRNVGTKGELTREGRLEKAQALGLGIEALKVRRQDKADGYIDVDDLLPGETEG